MRLGRSALHGGARLDAAGHATWSDAAAPPDGAADLDLSDSDAGLADSDQGLADGDAAVASPDLADSDPVVMLIDGDHERLTFDAFVAAELPALARYAAVLTGDRQAAHDILADALVTAQLKWHRIAPLEHPAAYVRRIVTTTFLSERRRWSVRHIRLTRDGELPDTAAPDPTVAFDDREHLSALLASLPPRQRAAIVLRFYLGLDTAAVATELGITAGAVRTAVSRGLAALRISIVGTNEHDVAQRALPLAPPAVDTATGARDLAGSASPGEESEA